MNIEEGQDSAKKRTMNLPQFEGSRILLVDDSPENLKVLLEYLKECEFKISIAQDGEEAFTLLKSFTPDLILLDVMMPGIDGFETCRRLKANNATKDIPVIFITALTGMKEKIRGFKLGGVDYITKPFRHEEVIARVNAHLTIQQQRRQLQEQNTRLQEQNALVKQQREQLEELNASKDKFFSIIAHDLKSPFAGIFVITHQLKEKIEQLSKDEIRYLADQLQTSVEKFSDFLDNLLTWSRIQQGIMEYRPQVLNTQHIFTRNIALFVWNAKQKQITLKNSVQEQISIYADVNMVDTVVRNLLSNAIKFTKVGGTVETSATCHEKIVEVAVSDTGIGIHSENLSTLFRIDTKYQRRGTADERGMGLGLILCKELIETNDGEIWVESEEGKGTTVKFTLLKAPEGHTEK